MIRSLRLRHRCMFIALAIALPLLVFIGLRARRAIPPMDHLPVTIQVPTENGNTTP